MKYNKWNADPDVEKPWDDYVKAEEEREGKKHLGVRATNRAIRFFLEAEKKRLQPALVRKPEPDEQNRTESSKTTVNEPSVLSITINGQSVNILGGISWARDLLKLLESGVGVQEFRQLLAIFQSGDVEIINAISCNLAVFARDAAVQKVLRDERAAAGVPAPPKASLSDRLQKSSKGANKDDRDAGEAIDKIKRSGKPDKGTGRKSG